MAPRAYPARRIEMIWYAGAPGGFHQIHWTDPAVRSAGLPSVIAHGMDTMAQAGRFAGSGVLSGGRAVTRLE
jgi:acyl dehydratase